MTRGGKIILLILLTERSHARRTAGEYDHPINADGTKSGEGQREVWSSGQRTKSGEGQKEGWSSGKRWNEVTRGGNSSRVRHLGYRIVVGTGYMGVSGGWKRGERRDGRWTGMAELSHQGTPRPHGLSDIRQDVHELDLRTPSGSSEARLTPGEWEDPWRLSRSRKPSKIQRKSDDLVDARRPEEP